MKAFRKSRKTKRSLPWQNAAGLNGKREIQQMDEKTENRLGVYLAPSLIGVLLFYILPFLWLSLFGSG